MHPQPTSPESPVSERPTSPGLWEREGQPYLVRTKGIFTADSWKGLKFAKVATSGWFDSMFIDVCAAPTGNWRKLGYINRLKKELSAPEVIEGRGQAVTWRKAEPSQQFYDNDQLLVAVPVKCRHGGKDYWEYSVVIVACDEEHFSMNTHDGGWGWEWSDVEWWIPFSSLTLPVIVPPRPAFVAPPKPELVLVRCKIKSGNQVFWATRVDDGFIECGCDYVWGESNVELLDPATGDVIA